MSNFIIIPAAQPQTTHNIVCNRIQHFNDMFNYGFCVVVCITWNPNPYTTFTSIDRSFVRKVGLVNGKKTASCNQKYVVIDLLCACVFRRHRLFIWRINPIYKFFRSYFNKIIINFMALTANTTKTPNNHFHYFPCDQYNKYIPFNLCSFFVCFMCSDWLLCGNILVNIISVENEKKETIFAIH